MKKSILFPVILAIVIVSGLVASMFIGREDVIEMKEANSPPAQTGNEHNIVQEVEVEPLEFSIDEFDSIWLVVNKVRPIDLDYIPKNIRPVDVVGRSGKSQDELSMRSDSAAALEKLFMGATNAGNPLLLGSGYRDSNLQEFYYSNYVSAYGQAEADKFSARPGTSEHQTGLVADVAPLDENCYLATCFADTDAGIWVSKNAHKYGFVIRYQLGKEKITGYQYEPWHLRYVGIDLATELFELNKSLEEYFNLI